MAEQRAGFDKVVLYLVLGVPALILIGIAVGASLSAPWNVLVYIATIGSVAWLLIGATRRTVGSSKRGPFPR